MKQSLTKKDLLKWDRKLREERLQRDPRAVEDSFDDDPVDHGVADGEFDFAGDEDDGILPLDQIFR